MSIEERIIGTIVTAALAVSVYWISGVDRQPVPSPVCYTNVHGRYICPGEAKCGSDSDCEEKFGVAP